MYTSVFEQKNLYLETYYSLANRKLLTDFKGN